MPETRWGRCYSCRRALRPGVSARVSPFLRCPQYRADPGHRLCMVLMVAQMQATDFPRVMLRRARVGF
eukprot:10994179-Alexandrium_andersonii.AAC.1